MGAGVTSRARLVLALHRGMVRSNRTPLRRIWALAYRLMAWAVCAYVARGEGGAATYLRGSVAVGDFVPGLSDVDTVVVFADGPGAEAVCRRARLRWERLSRLAPSLGLVLDGPIAFTQTELRELAATSVLTYGLDEETTASGSSAYFGAQASFDRLRQLERPGLYGAAWGWRPLRGPDRRPPEPRRSGGLRTIAAWLELLYLWRLAYPAIVDPVGPRSAALCVKLLCEPARIWLWLAHRERATGQTDVLERALRRLPQEEDAFRLGLELRRSLTGSPAPPLDLVLPPLLRISSRIAAQIETDLAADAVEVSLRGSTRELIEPAQDAPAAGGEAERLPLADWRALACPLLPDESLRLLEGDATDLATVAAAARIGRAGPYPALRAGKLMLLPAAPWWRTRLRAIKSSVSDPVSFALTEGAHVARFPTTAGWSVRDAARRGVAEHRAWLGGSGGEWSVRESSQGPGGTLALLLTAARPALLLESVEREDPELCLTVAEVGRALGERLPQGVAAAEQAVGEYREFTRGAGQPGEETISALRSLVRELPAYRA
jgi:hypothetical protein